MVGQNLRVTTALPKYDSTATGKAWYIQELNAIDPGPRKYVVAIGIQN